jgi:hypothetical protein
MQPVPFQRHRFPPDVIRGNGDCGRLNDRSLPAHCAFGGLT